MKAGFQYVLAGEFSKLDSRPPGPHPFEAGLRFVWQGDAHGRGKGDIKYDGKCTFDKETDVYYSGTTHEEKQPPHLKILDLETCLQPVHQGIPEPLRAILPGPCV